jgi:GNAT superfamily N-acetyltransferase/predicted nucleic acid-binding protein
MLVMRVLLDTNILISRENNHIVPENIAKLMRLLEKLNYSKHVHPLSIKEIEKDGNEERREVSLSKLKAYSTLDKYPDYSKDADFINKIGAVNNNNDIIDNQLIFCVHKNVVDCLVTEDIGILKKAKKLELDNVSSIDKAVNIFGKNVPNSNITLLSTFIKDKGFNFDLNDKFFDSLKEVYEEFSDWWKKKVTNRDVYAYKNNSGDINALLVPKIENRDEMCDCTPKFTCERILKICLLKVAERARGLKLGELLLRMAIDYAIQNKLDEMYLTLFPQKSDSLITLIERFGFYKYGENPRSEEVYLKKITPDKGLTINPDNILELDKKYYPSFYDGELVNKFIVPIIPEFHKKLFPDHKDYVTQYRQLPLPTLPPPPLQENSEGNSIEKAYICNANTKKIHPGDVVLFYKTNQERCKTNQGRYITSVGIVEEVLCKQKDRHEIMKRIVKRTVFSPNDIKEMLDKNKNKCVLVLLFYHNFNLKNNFSLAEFGWSAPQSITKIEHNKYKRIIEGNIDERFIIN